MKEVIMQVQSFSADYPKALIYVGDLVCCKNCNHYVSDGGAMMVCDVFEWVMPEDFYCKYGERKDNDLLQG